MPLTMLEPMVAPAPKMATEHASELVIVRVHDVSHAKGHLPAFPIFFPNFFPC